MIKGANVVFFQPDPSVELVVLETTPAGQPDVMVPRVFKAAIDEAVTIEIAAERGRTRITKVTVEEVDGRGVDSSKLAQLRLPDLLSKTTTNMARFYSDSPAAGPAGAKASRRRVSDERLQAVADAYEAGGIETVMKAVYVGERQAWRLKARAVEQGFLEQEND